MNQLFDITGKVAVVTGGTRGIGLAIALGLKEAGVKVYIHGSKLEATKEVAKKHGLEYVYANLMSRTERMAMVEEIKSKESKIDILINNAGYEVYEDIANANEDTLENVYRVNAQAPFMIVKDLVPLLEAARKSSVINVTSIHQSVAVKTNGYYCMAKAALAMFTKVAALELAGKGIRVNNVAPGAIETDMNRELIQTMDFDQWIPMGRVGEVEELLGPILFLASDASSYMTASTITVDGGYSENLLRY